ncbi:MAG: hypothetical protein JO162_04995 [Alphaproteobacteria bacterium]|nr:hypothetical protein [Alphaproteobacteria bacterium]
MPSVATALDIARLYEELRECVRANDQEGVKRVFAELVRARRPVPEILAEVKSLTKEREKLEERVKSGPERPAFEPREWSVQVARSDTPPTAGGSQVLRNVDSASATPQPASSSSIAPRPVLEGQPAVRDKPLDRASANLPKSAPEPAAHRQSGSLTSSVGPENSGSPEAPAKSSPERFGSTPIETPKTGAVRVQNQHPPSSASPSTEAPVMAGPAAASAPSSTTIAATPAPHESTSNTPARPQPTPVVGAANKPDPTPQTSALQQVVARTLAAEPSPAATTVNRPSGGIESRTAPARSEQLALATSAQVSGTALSLRQSLDLSSDEIEERQPARRVPIMVLAIVAVAIVAIGGTGWFWLSQKSGGQVAGEIVVRPEATASTAETKTQASTALRPDAVVKSPESKAPTPAPSAKPTASPTPPIAGARERPRADSAAASPARNAVAPDPSANPAAAAAPSGAASATPAPPQSDVASAAKLEPPKDAAPMPAVPESTSPAAPTLANPPTPTMPAEPSISPAEAADLLSRGDTAFGVGDIASARLFYERAADAGSGEAALRLGETYDPNFLERAKLRSVQGDPKAAIHWYWRAKELGIAEADILLKGMQTK